MKMKTELKKVIQNSTCKLGQTIVQQQIENIEEISRKISDRNASRISETQVQALPKRT